MTEAKKSLSILTIGNSFTDSLTSFFQPVVESAGCELYFERANHGGCELHRHWNYIENEERDRVFRMYQNYTHTMKEILQSRAWDIVTIQQASHASWRPETFEPYGTNIYEYIRKNAPSAEVCIQQTWAYRLDNPHIIEGGDWGIDQTEMYKRLTANYRKLAADHGNLRIIPTGYAVQLARQNQPHAFVNYDPKLLDTLVWPDLPSQAWSLVGKMVWQKDQETGEMKIARDTIHLNKRGEYMQACVWFAFLYHRNTSEITFVPDCISDKDAEFLRKMAQKAVDEFPQA